MARLLEDNQTEADDRLALDSWRRVVRLSPAATEAWFSGKLGIARLLIRQGDKPRAAEMLQVLQALHPGLGGPQQAIELEQLLQQATIDP